MNQPWISQVISLTEDATYAVLGRVSPQCVPSVRAWISEDVLGHELGIQCFKTGLLTLSPLEGFVTGDLKKGASYFRKTGYAIGKIVYRAEKYSSLLLFFLSHLTRKSLSLTLFMHSPIR